MGDLVPRPAGQLPRRRLLTDHPLVVQRRIDELRARAARDGLLVECVPRERFPDGRVTIAVHFLVPAPRAKQPLIAWRTWSRRQWVAIGTGAAVGLGGCGWAAALAIQALVVAALTAAQAVATGALGLLFIAGALVFVKAIFSGGGGTWTGGGTWSS